MRHFVQSLVLGTCSALALGGGGGAFGQAGPTLDDLVMYGVWNYGGDTASRLVRINMLTASATMLESETGFGNVEGMTAVENLNRGPGPDAPTSVILRDSSGNDAFRVTFLDVTFNDDGTSSWTYKVEELDGGADMSHWALAINECHTVMPGTTEGYDLGIDGSSGFYGIKWDVEDGFEVGEFTIVLDKHYAGTEGGTGIGVLTKGGHHPDVDEIFGPTCDIPAEYVLYAVHTDSSGSHALISIDPATGAGKSEMTLSRKYEGLAAGADGTLFGVADSELWRIDPFADSETHLGTADFYNVEALEFAFGNDAPAVEIPDLDPAFWTNGVLFGFSDDDDTLMIFNVATGEARPYASALALADIEAFTFVTMQSDPQPKIQAVLFD